MRGENLLINIKELASGNVSRITRKEAQSKVDSGLFSYISNSEFRKITRPKIETTVSTVAETAEKIVKTNKTAKSKNSKQLRDEMRK